MDFAIAYVCRCGELRLLTSFLSHTSSSFSCTPPLPPHLALLQRHATVSATTLISTLCFRYGASTLALTLFLGSGAVLPPRKPQPYALDLVRASPPRPLPQAPTSAATLYRHHANLNIFFSGHCPAARPNQHLACLPPPPRPPPSSFRSRRPTLHPHLLDQRH